MEVKEYTDKANNLFISINQSIAYIKHLKDEGIKVDRSQDTILIEEDLKKVDSIIKELEQVALCPISQLKKIKEEREKYYAILDNMRRRL